MTNKEHVVFFVLDRVNLKGNITVDTQNTNVLIIGAGVTGAALAYVLEKYSSVGSVTILEKEAAAGMVNSHPLNNAQTSHDGSTETNHDLEEALSIRPAAIALRRYIDQHPEKELSYKRTRMVLGVGENECLKLIDRHDQFGEYYPDLEFLDRAALMVHEPAVVEGRDPRIPLCAIMSTEGYAVNYQRLCEVFLEESPKTNTVYQAEVHSISKNVDGYLVTTHSCQYQTKVLVCAAGPYSLLFAQSLGYGEGLGILPVAGSFFSAGNLLNGKVYTVQLDGVPFAAVHGDPDVLNPEVTRFGPTVKVLPRLERADMRSTWTWLRSPMASLKGLWAFLKMFRDPRVLRFALKSALYDVPMLGKWMFLKDVRKIVPAIQYRDLTLRKGVGGIRPQIVDLESGETKLGEATLYGDCAIFSTTPSPGASVCLWNARSYAKEIAKFLGDESLFNQDKFDDLFTEKQPVNHVA